MKKLSVLLILGLLLPLYACAAAEPLRVDFYDVGKADAMLITTPAGSHILIDTGTNKNGKDLVKRFQEEGIGPIDLMIITHYDKDHVGGADKIIEDVGVRHVVMPVYDKESKQYEQFVEAIGEHAIPSTQLITAHETTLTVDGVTLRISAAHKSSYGKDEENDFSLCVRMTHGNTRFLFPGDAETPRQRELIAEGDLACDVLKVPYHGRLTDASQDFLSAAAPQIAFIPDSEDDPSHELIHAMLTALGAKIHSAQQGDLTVLSDGARVWTE
ncbi:MAG: MBL fold metallo-hydrolase [Clostridia bacterium]|nr:MBL fold metallo-hydrolase [Clostridia bacterium]